MTTSTNENIELNANEQAILASLRNPDLQETISLTNREIDEILYCYLYLPAFHHETRRFLKPDILYHSGCPNTVQKLVAVANHLSEQYGSLPSPAILEAILKQIQNEDLRITCLAYFDSIHQEHHTLDPVRAIPYYKDKLWKFVRLRLMEKATAEFQKTHDFAVWDKLKRELEQPSEQSAQSLDDLLRYCEANPLEWLCDGWFMSGGLHMLAGHSFDGKSVLVAQLASWIASGLPCLDAPTIKTPVLIIDNENHPSIICRRMQHKESDDVMWHTKTTLRKYLPLTPPKLQSLLEQHQELVGHNRLAVFIDTFSSCFDVDEREPDQVNELLYALQSVAQSTNSAVTVLQHRPKNNAAYAGHNAMMRALDFFMKYERISQESPTAILSMDGSRLAKPKPVSLTYDPATENLTIGVPPKVAQEQALEKLIFEAVESRNNPTGIEVVQYVKDSWDFDFECPGENKITSKLASWSGVKRHRGPKGFHYTPQLRVIEAMKRLSEMP